MVQKELAEHNSQDLYYRCPTGAVAAGSTVRIGIKVRMREAVTKVLLRLWREGVGEKLVPLATKDAADETENEIRDRFFSAEIGMPEHGCLLWYYFIISTAEHTFFYGNNDAHWGGLGTMYEQAPPSFQITVYNREADTPAWFRQAVMYQIFPDRFFRSGDRIVEKRGAVIHASWQDAPCYYKDADTKEIVAYDFFGGNLAGIRAKLPYLQDLGISVLYLNPVFESESNHHYDTGDYLKIDPMLGTNAEFAELCQAAKDRGIRVILDGVFSHTGSNSRYFNRRGQYDTVGAFQSRQSPYYEWYNFRKYPYEYDSWWGFSTLPNVSETTPSYMDFIIRNKDSVLHHWLAAGISGWRLDVVDELPAKFTQTFYREMKHTDPEAVLIGEVWEDASNKISYGVPREYLCGQEIDGAMNYPFRQIVLDFLLGNADGAAVVRRLCSLQENYPAHNFYAMMNLLGSHDVPRLLTVLGEAPFYEGMPAIHQAHFRLDGEHFNLGVARVAMAVLWQMTFPGVPSVYYGDEIGMQGFKDPYNRCPYDWQGGDAYLKAWNHKLIALRNAHAALSTGEFLPLAGTGDTWAYARVIRGGRDVFGKPAANEVFVAAFNRSRTTAAVLELEVGDLACGSFVDALATGVTSQVTPLCIDVHRGRLKLEVPPLMAVLYRQQAAEHRYARAAGILLHPTSLPSKYGIGDFGREAYEFIDFLADAGQKVWQILPLNPVGYGYSPYQSPSAFAGNPMLISLDKLIVDGWLTAQEAKLPFADSSTSIDFERVWAFKEKCLRHAWQAFRMQPPSDYAVFCEQEAGWLEDYALFKASKADAGGAAWMDWSPVLKRRDEAALAAQRIRLASEMDFVKFQQYIFARQWQELHAYAKSRQIRIMGDMPLFISQDSADVWAHQELFELEGSGRAASVAGVPPDYFSKTGQLWGNPQYRWLAMKAEHYAWWIQRFRKLFSLVDVVRIDHFRGFESYWEIDGHAQTAENGRWVKGPGKAFFDAVEQALGRLPIVAEDLGVITDEVESLRDACGFPGMKVLQFELGFNSAHRIGLAAPENSIVYTGTHDNNTAAGWYAEDIDGEQQTAVAMLLGADRTKPAEVCARLVEYAYASSARMAIIPMQDVLGLNSGNRMNLPGTVGKNWGWRLRPHAFAPGAAGWLHGLVRKYQR